MRKQIRNARRADGSEREITITNEWMEPEKPGDPMPLLISISNRDTAARSRGDPPTSAVYVCDTVADLDLLIERLQEARQSMIRD